MTDIPVISDVTIADMHADPTSVYARMRRETPVALLKATGRVLLTKADDVRAAKDNSDVWTAEDTTTPAERAFQATSMMRKDGPVHRAERMSIQPGMSAKKIKADWRASAEAHARKYLDPLTKGDRVEMLNQVAAPFAGGVLRDVLGMQGARDDDLVRWSQIFIDGAGNVAGDEAVFARCDAVNAQVNANIDHNLARLTQEPDSSVLTSMAATSTLDRIRCNVKVCIGGGVNEPRDALLTTLYGLLTNPDQLADVKADPQLFTGAFEEAVRWVAPIQLSPRVNRVPVTLQGITLPAGTRVSVIQASGNRDTDAFEDPDAFNIHRSETRHYSFGNGAHFCMGAHLSRMSIGEVLLPMLFERFPDIALENASAVPWYGYVFRGPTELRVRL